MPTALNDNINSGNLHASLPTDHGSKQRSFLEVVLANDQGDLNTLARHWGVVRRSDHLVGLPTSLRAEPSFGPVSSVTSYAAPALGHKYPLHPQSYQPTASQSAMNRVRSFSSLVAPGPRDPLRVQINYQEGDEGKTSIRGVDTNARNPNQPSTGLGRTGQTQTWGVQSYVPSLARVDGHGNPEAGQATPVPPHTQLPIQLTTNNSGWTPRATANAECNPPCTEKDAVPHKRDRRSRGEGKPRVWRLKQQEGLSQLCAWARTWRNFQKLVTREEALETALKAVKERRKPIYLKPRLRRGISERTKAGVRDNDEECERRKAIRRLHEELSKYYPLQEGKRFWTARALVSEVLEEVQNLPRSSAGLPTQGSTSMTASEETRAISLPVGVSTGVHPTYVIDEYCESWEDTAAAVDEDQ